jgi:Tfp pilus assembly pilus retraction ATPase PilT
MSSSTVQSRGWIVTEFDLVNPDIIQGLLRGKGWGGVFQLEAATAAEGQHYRIYVESSTPIRFSTMKRLFPNAVVEMRSTSKQDAYAFSTQELTRLAGPWSFTVDEKSGLDGWVEGLVVDAVAADASDLMVTVQGSSVVRVRSTVDGRNDDFPYSALPDSEAGLVDGLRKVFGLGAIPGVAHSYTFQKDGVDWRARVFWIRSMSEDVFLVKFVPFNAVRKLKDSGFSSYDLELVKGLLNQPGKIILVSGPTGSGKTETVYSMLQELVDDYAVLSVEDPVERLMPGMTQVELNSESGLDFQAVRRSLSHVRKDVLFVGEARDAGVASSIVLESVVEGTQTFTTLHADSNMTALMRFISLSELDASLVLSAVGGVITQRMVRCLNPEWNGVDLETRYKGVSPVWEVTVLDDSVVDAVLSGAPLVEVASVFAEAEGSTFAVDAQRLMDEGVTDEEELVRVLGRKYNEL